MYHQNSPMYYQKSPKTSKEPYFGRWGSRSLTLFLFFPPVKRALYHTQKSPMYSQKSLKTISCFSLLSKEPYITPKRALCNLKRASKLFPVFPSCQKSPISHPKEPYVLSKEPQNYFLFFPPGTLLITTCRNRALLMF